MIKDLPYCPIDGLAAFIQQKNRIHVHVCLYQIAENIKIHDWLISIFLLIIWGYDIMRDYQWCTNLT